MKEQLINEIELKMLPYLNNEQLLQLRNTLRESLHGATVSYDTDAKSEDIRRDAVEAFITAKRIEGCSEKTLGYYRKTIEAMLSGIGKTASQITTDDLRKYLTSYQRERGSSKVTIDNIRRILSSFFSWLEDEDFIVKSPVRRIHKVKTAKVIKDTYTDEAMELMRDSCATPRDLVIIDLLASSGMRVGDDDDKIRLNQRKPSKYKGLSRFGPEKNLQRINKFMKERPTFYKKLIQMKENFRFYLRCFYCITKVVILQFNSEKQDRISS